MDAFAQQMVAYYRERGRKQLPWQHPRTPYRIWVSEIMLQQTQLDRVVTYFNRFVASFPDVSALAEADPDHVLAHWSGLGYYARARNLHKAARLIVERHNGEVPCDLASLIALPGIGRSTAGAILCAAYGIATPILDGNVRRVLSRFHGVDGRTGESVTEKQLWRLAGMHTPSKNIEDYTQGIMDFGARLCRRHNPGCGECPLCEECLARVEGRVEELPVPRKRNAKPLRRVRFFLVTDTSGRVLLELRPTIGIWGGLWTLPERDLDKGIDEFLSDIGLVDNCKAVARPGVVRELPAPETFRHHFSHFDLEVHPVRLLVDRFVDGYSPTSVDSRRWTSPREFEQLGMPSATKRLLADAVELPSIEVHDRIE